MPAIFSYHAADRMSQRLNIKVPTEREVNIESAFCKVKTYEHNVKGIMVEAWVNKDLSNPIVLIVGKLNRTVMTVLSNDAPFVRECYALYRQRTAH